MCWGLWLAGLDPILGLSGVWVYQCHATCVSGKDSFSFLQGQYQLTSWARWILSSLRGELHPAKLGGDSSMGRIPSITIASSVSSYFLLHSSVLVTRTKMTNLSHFNPTLRHLLQACNEGIYDRWPLSLPFEQTLLSNCHCNCHSIMSFDRIQCGWLQAGALNIAQMSVVNPTLK